MTPPLVFLDTETTHLHPELRRPWEIAAILRSDYAVPDLSAHETGEDDEYLWYVDHRDLDLANADPFALQVGKFYERHPDFADTEYTAKLELQVMYELEEVLRGAHVIGAVPDFDTNTLDRRMRACGIAPSWHYHIIDVESMMVGFLAAFEDPPELPWKSDDLSRLVGIPGLDEFGRHTAMGDARWARAIWDRMYSRNRQTVRQLHHEEYGTIASSSAPGDRGAEEAGS